MAKVKGPLFSIEGSGKIHKSLIYSENKGITKVKGYKVPINPNTDDQKGQRGFMTNAVLAWKTDGYTVADIEAWNVYAKMQKGFLSGYNLFLRNRINAEKAEENWQKLTNCVISNLTTGGCTVVINTAVDRVGILFVGTSKVSMLIQFVGIFDTDHYTFEVTGLIKGTRYYFYVKNTSGS